MRFRLLILILILLNISTIKAFAKDDFSAITLDSNYSKMKSAPDFTNDISVTNLTNNPIKLPDLEDISMTNNNLKNEIQVSESSILDLNRNNVDTNFDDNESIAPVEANEQKISELNSSIPTNLTNTTLKNKLESFKVTPTDPKDIQSLPVGNMFINILQKIDPVDIAEAQQTEDNSSLNNTNAHQSGVTEGTPIPLDATVEDTKTATSIGDVDDKEVKHGFLLFNDRFSIKPELLTVMTGNTGQVKGPMGIVGRLRTYLSALVIRGKKDKFIGEGRINARLNMAAGFNPLKNRALSSIDGAYTDALGPNQGVNIGNNDSIKTQLGFLDELNYTQNFYIKKLKTTWTQSYGFIDLTDYFDQNQFADNKGEHYTNTTFTNNRTFIPNETSLGIVWRLKHPWVSWAIAAVPMDPWQFDNAFAPMTELAFTPKIMGRQGHYRVGLFEVLSRRMGNYFFHDNVVGVDVSFDQQITKNIGIWGRFGDIGISNADKLPFFFPSTEATKNSNPFVRTSWFFKTRRPGTNFEAVGDYLTSVNYGANNLPVRQTFSFGMQIDKPFNIKNGTWAFAYGQNWRIFRGRLIDDDRNPPHSRADFTNRASEKVLEFDYRHKLSKLFTITPFLQIIFSQAGHSDLLPAVVLGIRSNYKI